MHTVGRERSTVCYEYNHQVMQKCISTSSISPVVMITEFMLGSSLPP